MRFLAGTLVLLALAAQCVAQAAAPGGSVSGCTLTAGNCRASKQELKQAAQAFQRGVQLKNAQRPAEALEAFEKAARLVPDNVEYLTAREIARQQLVYAHLEQGNQFLLAQRRVEALAEFRAALELDPANEFALQRLQDAVGEFAPKASPGLQLAAQSDTIELAPRAGRQDFHYRGDTRGLIETIARAFGVRAFFDDSVSARSVRFDVEGADFHTAMKLAGQMTKTFWSPASASEFLVAADTPENRRQFERLAMRTFYVSDVASVQEMNDLIGVLRGVFDLRLISPQPSKNTLVVRGPQRTLEAATRLLESLAEGPPQVMLDIQAFEVSRTALRNLGVQMPLQFQMFNLPSSALALAASPGIQALINQLIASGGINQANTTAIAALLAQLQAQQNPLLSQPFATFGGGITLFGVTIPTVVLNANLNESRVSTLEHVTLRALQGKAATFHVGSRFPILNATFSPIFNSPALSQVIQNLSFRNAFPSFTYEDLGIMVKATPRVHGASDVTLDLETNIRTLSSSSFNGVPVIANREFKGTITVKNGEMAVVVGMITDSEQKSLHGLPGLGQLPGVGRAFSNENKQEVHDELLVVITPHILKVSPEAGAAEIWLAPSK